MGGETKGKTYEEIYGPERAIIMRAHRVAGGTKPKATKGKTYEEIYGKEKAQELKNLRAKNGHKLTANIKGKTWDQFYGSKKSKDLKKARSGPKSHLWRGGFSLFRGSNWDTQRKKALKRDGYKCQDCGKSHVILDVHHIVPYRIKKSNALKGLISLCKPCHLKADRKWRRENENSTAQP